MFVTRLRTVSAISRAALAPKATISRLPCRVSWLDCDLNFHMTNSRYIQFMDTGRAHQVVSSGAWRVHRHVRMVVVEEKINFRRELKPQQRFILDTRLVGFRGKALVFEQHFLTESRSGGETKETTHAKAEVVSLLLHRGRVVPAPQVRGLEALFAPAYAPA